MPVSKKRAVSGERRFRVMSFHVANLGVMSGLESVHWEAMSLLWAQVAVVATAPSRVHAAS